MKSHNTSGVAGVTCKVLCYVATWNDNDGNACSKIFTKAKYGDEGAKQKAIDYRNEMIRQLPHYREALNL